MERPNAKPVVSWRELEFRLGVDRQALTRFADEAESHYQPFEQSQGEKTRTIDNPTGFLKEIQRRINVELLGTVALPEHVHGGVKGKSPLTNAARHVGKRYVLRADVKNFFPSVTNVHVFALWRTLGYSPTLARVLTKLTTYKGHLPQGAPTSTMLANLVLLPADVKIGNTVERPGGAHTRFVDDVAVSGEHPRERINDVIGALRASGFRVSHRKLNVMARGERQELTGYTLNSKRGPSKPRPKRDAIRAAIHALRHSELDPEQRERAIRSIRGRIQDVRPTNPGSARRLESYLDEVLNGITGTPA